MDGDAGHNKLKKFQRSEKINDRLPYAHRDIDLLIIGESSMHSGTGVDPRVSDAARYFLRLVFLGGYGVKSIEIRCLEV